MRRDAAAQMLMRVLNSAHGDVRKYFQDTPLTDQSYPQFPRIALWIKLVSSTGSAGTM